MKSIAQELGKTTVEKSLVIWDIFSLPWFIELVMLEVVTNLLQIIQMQQRIFLYVQTHGFLFHFLK